MSQITPATNVRSGCNSSKPPFVTIGALARCVAPEVVATGFTGEAVATEKLRSFILLPNDAGLAKAISKTGITLVRGAGRYALDNVVYYGTR